MHEPRSPNTNAYEPWAVRMLSNATGADAARTRGHRDVVTVVTVPLEAGGVEIVAGLADRKQETVAACLRTIPALRRHTIERACTDMDAGFVNALTEDIPWGKLVIDRFPVARAYRDWADTVRQ